MLPSFDLGHHLVHNTNLLDCGLSTSVGSGVVDPAASFFYTLGCVALHVPSLAFLCANTMQVLNYESSHDTAAIIARITPSYVTTSV